MTIEIKKFQDFKVSDWSGGRTWEIIIDPENSNVANRDFSYRVSTATCELDQSEFSDYTGYMRYISPVDGVLKLYKDGQEHSLEAYQVFHFSGEDKIISKGKVRDYNLIYKKDLEGSLESFEIEESFKVELEEKTTLIQSFDSPIDYKLGTIKGKLETKDALILKGERGILELKAEKTRFFMVKI